MGKTLAILMGWRAVMPPPVARAQSAQTAQTPQPGKVSGRPVRVRITGAADGRRVRGKALAIDRGVLTFVADNDTGPSSLPLAGISRIELALQRHSWTTAIAAGVGVGVGALFAMVAAVFEACGDDNSRCINHWAPLVLVVPPIAGGVVGALLRGPSWLPISASELELELKRK